jgi:FkbM family methyltransferase
MPPTETPGLKRPLITARHVILVLALSVTALFAAKAGPSARRAIFKATGVVRTEGLKFHLDPRDEVITETILQYGTWEKSETEVVRRLLRPGDTFVDVGANVGWYTLIASRAVGETGRVIAFEPAPGSYSLLAQNAKDNGCRNVILESKALSDKRGTLRLNIGATNKGHNSIISSSLTKGFVDVEALPLDEYLKDLPGKIDLIKIDTEGAEGFILNGMTQTFRKNPKMAVIMEYFPTLIRKAGFDPAAILHDFYRQGYTVRIIALGTGRTNKMEESDMAEMTSTLEKNGEYTNILVDRP